MVKVPGCPSVCKLLYCFPVYTSWDARGLQLCWSMVPRHVAAEPGRSSIMAGAVQRVHALLWILDALGVLVAAEPAVSVLEASIARRLAVKAKTCSTSRLGGLPFPGLDAVSSALPSFDVVRPGLVVMEHFIKAVPGSHCRRKRFCPRPSPTWRTR